MREWLSALAPGNVVFIGPCRLGNLSVLDFGGQIGQPMQPVQQMGRASHRMRWLHTRMNAAAPQVLVVT